MILTGGNVKNFLPFLEGDASWTNSSLCSDEDGEEDGVKQGLLLTSPMKAKFKANRH